MDDDPEVLTLPQLDDLYDRYRHYGGRAKEGTAVYDILQLIHTAEQLYFELNLREEDAFQRGVEAGRATY